VVKVVGVLEYGGPEALEVLELPDPRVGPGQVRIRVHAAAVSPTDTSVRNGARPMPPRPIKGWWRASARTSYFDEVPTLRRMFAITSRAGWTVLPDGALLNGHVALAVRDGGTVVTVRGYSDSGERGVTFRPIRVAEYAKAHEKLDRLRRLVEEGKIGLRVAGTVPKERAAEAHRRLEAGGVRGRMVIEF